ncbi:MAG: 1-acyl-sn-glycerol-3-phosphate acyltransferase [Bdellovibrionales bacterium]|nr:1-acyl-sn-glycerol-3-phosphate acyltransferase [Bdellovibrionales bacterium]
MIGRVVSAFFIYSLKIISRIFYRTEAIWLTPKEQIHWEELRIAAVLNHTSLFEPIFVSALPNYRICRAVIRVVVPIADVTMNRPMVGALFRLLVPNAFAITRRRDETWDRYIAKAKDPNSLMLLFPEGRMKRKDGLDKKGRPMSVKSGVADIIWEIKSGKMLVCYSGGLHHVQAPGELIPRIFKKIRISFQEIDIADYIQQSSAKDVEAFREFVVADLESKMKLHCG